MAAWPTSPSIRSRLARRFDPVELRAIKKLWVRHSIAEDARDIDGLSRRSRPTACTRSSRRASAGTGHDGARAFYTELFAAFPDNRFALTDIVVGPQGVFEAAELTGTNLGPWAGVPPSGLPVSLEVLILFPWDPATERFARRADLVRPGCLRRRNGPVPRRREDGAMNSNRPTSSVRRRCGARRRGVRPVGRIVVRLARPGGGAHCRLGYSPKPRRLRAPPSPCRAPTTRCRWSSTRTSRATTCSRCSSCSATPPSTCAASPSRPRARCTACRASATPAGSSPRSAGPRSRSPAAARTRARTAAGSRPSGAPARTRSTASSCRPWTGRPRATRPRPSSWRGSRRASDAPLTLVTLGPLSNVADAASLDPAFASHLAGIHAMAGTIDAPGNIAYGDTSPADGVEWNVGADPDAMAAVLALDVPMTLVGLDATNDVPVPADIVDQLSRRPRRRPAPTSPTRCTSARRSSPTAATPTGTRWPRSRSPTRPSPAGRT